MKLKRMVVPKPPMVKKQTKGGKKGAAQAPPPQADAIISQHAPGLGFDFSPSDSNLCVHSSTVVHTMIDLSTDIWYVRRKG